MGHRPMAVLRAGDFDYGLICRASQAASRSSNQRSCDGDSTSGPCVFNADGSISLMLLGNRNIILLHPRTVVANTRRRGFR